MKTKKRVIALRISIIVATCLLVTSVILIFCNIFNSKDDNDFKYRVDQYVASQYAIEAANASNDTTNVSISGFSISGTEITTPGGITPEDIRTKTLTIKDASELKLFSDLCNFDSNYLSYSYRLIANINYNISQEFELIGWKQEEAFSGVFEGAGYEISNLKLKTVSNDDIAKQYNEGGIDYFAMFSRVSGTVRNLGLVSPRIIISSGTLESHTQGVNFVVSPLIGLNKGTVQNVYVKDLRDPIEDESGITASGGYIISGLMGRNDGKFENAYTAYSIVSNYVINDYIDFTEILYEKGTGTSVSTKDIYFYNESIDSYTGSDSQLCVIVYNKGLIDKKFVKTVYGNRVATKSDLRKAFKEKEITIDNVEWKWYVLSDYANEIQNKLNIELPMLRGLILEKEKDSKNENYGKYIATISTLQDYSYMYELMRTNAFFASNELVYKIVNDINLASLPREIYTYDGAIAATIEGVDNYNYSSVTMQQSKNNSYPTIYNGSVMNKVITEGVECYGLFPYVTGKIKNLNIVTNATITADDNNNVKAIGLVSGYVDGGVIENVNAFGDVVFSSSIGKTFAAGAVGLLGGEGIISKVTAAGNLSNTNGTSSSNSESTFVNGNSYGGIVGSISNTLGSVITCYSNVSITISANLNRDYAIGGVIGSGYTKDVRELVNTGSVTLTVSGANEVYAAGVLGRHLGQTQQVQYFNNYGDVTVNNLGSKTYVSGVSNSDITVTRDSSNPNRTISQLKNKGKAVYYASQFINGANIKVNNSNNNNLFYTNVLNIKSGNGFQSTISGIYNLGYRSNVDDKSRTKLSSQEISMSQFTKFAAVFNAIDTNVNNTVTAGTVYNLKSINFTDGVDNSELEINYSGIALGDYVTLSDVRNEGNLIFKVSSNITVKKFIVSGIIKTVSPKCTLSNAYNNGNIELDTNYKITGDVYLSGICYQNQNGFTDVELAKFNPTSATYDSDKTGSLDTIINKGNIKVTNSAGYENIIYEHKDRMSSNGTVTNSRDYLTEYSGNNIIGNINISGITYINQSVITNTFNLGDLFAANYINQTTENNEINVSGIVDLNVGEKAYIINSANNGSIKAINLSSYDVFYNGKTDINVTTAQKAFVNASGIVARNDKNEDGTKYVSNSNGHTKQIIAFSTNYGSIYTYSYYSNQISSASSEFRCVSGGIVGQGLLNMINTVNYGNISSSELAGGIFGLLFFEIYETEANNSNNVNLANTMNYGNVYVIDKGDSNYKNSNSKNQTYTSFSNLTDTTKNVFYTELELFQVNYYIGSVFGVLNFNKNENAKYVNIRYLISFNENVPLVGAEAATPTVSTDLSTLFSAYKRIVDGIDAPDNYLGQNVEYAPLSTGQGVISGKAFYGVFNQDFKFRKAIEGKETLEIATNKTDAFLTDYFQFVNYQFINENLLEKVGWRNVAYLAAGHDFAMDINNVIEILDKYTSLTSLSTKYQDLLNSVLKTDSWMLYCSNQNLSTIANELVKSNEYTATLNYIKFLLIDSSSTSVLLSSNVLTSILDIAKSGLSEVDYSNLLTEILEYNNGYSTLLADVILQNDSNDIKDSIVKVINDLDSDFKENLVKSYVDSLTDDYFSYGLNENIRQKILSDLLKNINDNEFYKLLIEKLEITSGEYSDEFKMYNGYQELTDDKKTELFKSIVANNSPDEIYAYLNAMSLNIGMYEKLINDGYNVSNIDEVKSLIKYNETSKDESVVDERINLYNKIRITDTFKNYIKDNINNDNVYLATEHRNTFQSFTPPVESGGNGDLSYSYTSTVTPLTYFYGPYKDVNKNMCDFSKNVDTIPSEWNEAKYLSILDYTTYKEYKENLDKGYCYEYAVYLYEYGDSNSNNQFTRVDIEKNDDSKYAFTWFKTNYNTDFTGSYLNGTYYTDNSFDPADVTYKDQETGVFFSINGGAISGFTSETQSTINEAGYKDNLERKGSWYVTDSNKNRHKFTGTVRNWADFIIKHGVRHYICLPTEKYHSTKLTGIFKYSAGVRWFIWNSEAKRVHTSQYIDYSVDDLLNLDGVLTNYDNDLSIEGIQATYASQTERNIINDLFENYFINDSSFEKIVQKSLFETLVKDVNDKSYMNNFIYKNIYTNTVFGTNKPTEYLNVGSSETLNNFLKDKCNIDTSENKEKLIAAASNNKNVYSNLIKEILNYNHNLSDSEIADALEYRSNLGEKPDDTYYKEVQENYQTYKNDIKSYTRAITFKSIKFNTQPGKNLAVVLRALNNEASVTISYGSTSETFNVSENIEELSISAEKMENVNEITLKNDNGNCYLFDVFQYDVTSTDTSGFVKPIEEELNFTVDNLTGKEFQMYTEEDILSRVKANITSIPKDINIKSITAVCKATNRFGYNMQIRLKMIEGETENIISEDKIAPNSEGTITISDAQKYYGRTFELIRGYDSSTPIEDSQFNSISFNVQYSYSNQNHLLTTEIINDSKIRSSKYNDAIFMSAVKEYDAILKEYKYPKFLNLVLLNLIPICKESEYDSGMLNEIVNKMYNKDAFIDKVIKSSSNTLYKFIDFAVKSMSSDNSKKDYVDKIFIDLSTYDHRFLSANLLNEKSKLSDEYKKFLAAAYLSTKYTYTYNQSKFNSEIFVYDTEFKQLLDDLNANKKDYSKNINYITSKSQDNPFNNEYYDNLLEYLDKRITTTGYGIYALASNKGILNGAFIPDNVVLDNMKSYYIKLENYLENYYVLTSERGSYWRGGTADDSNNKDNIDSVNHHILVEMKQLKQSISTTVFTLDLVDDKLTHYSSKSAIDLTNHTIIYFVPQGYVSEKLNGHTLTIDNNTLSIANLAKITGTNVTPDDADSASTLTSITFPETGNTITNAFRVFAEDRSVYADYDIIFEEIHVDFSLSYNQSTSNTAVSVDTSLTTAKVSLAKNSVVIDLSSTALPEKLDLTPYISIRKFNGDNYEEEKNNLEKYIKVENAFTLSNDPLDHVINSEHSTTITLEITRAVTQGNYLIVIDIFGEVEYLYLVKEASTENSITEFIYEGNDITKDISKGSYSSEIPYGRLFSKAELEDYLSSHFYLNAFSVSEGAIIDIVASYEKNTSGLYVYTVNYNITSESGATQTYIHTLTEIAPYKVDESFATIYKNGSSEGDRTYTNSDNTINVLFTRDEGEPKYRVKYILTNFYTIGDKVNYSLSDDTLDNKSYSELTYAGVTGAVYSSLEPGSYEYQYIYTNLVNWDDNTVCKSEYQFPKLVITKRSSVNSSLQQLAFLDSYMVLGGLSTIISPTNSLRPGGPNENIYSQFSYDDNNEVNYFDYSNKRTMPNSSAVYDTGIKIETKDINYGNHTTDKDYFIVGAVSNAELENYAPTFGIDEYAEIYQYTTITKITGYGTNQTKSDHEILTTHTDRYIYVPFTNDGGETIVRYLVKIDDYTGEWTDVYPDDYNGTGDKVGTMSGKKGYFISPSGVKYTTDITAGVSKYIQDANDIKQYNSSLYMDYIGTPKTNHFWYVSYVIFSEDYLINEGSETTPNNNLTYYHIALIDLTNNVLFNVKVFAPTAIANNSFYVNIAYNNYRKVKKDDGSDTYENEVVKNQISAFAVLTSITSSYKVYELDNKLQILPSGYFYFYIDLPDGYIAKAKFSKPNTLDPNSSDTSVAEMSKENAGSYLPPSSIVTQKIDIEIYIEAGTDLDSSSWGISVTDTFTKQIALLPELITSKD